MRVSLESLPSVRDKLMHAPRLSLDTETTGLRPYLGDRLFSIIVATHDETFYFNYNTEPDCNGNLSLDILPRTTIKEVFTPLVSDPTKLIYLANAKFDMHMLTQEGVREWRCAIHDVLVIARLIYNDHMSYDLDSVAKRAGFAKSNAVEDFIKENKLWAWVTFPGKKKRDKDKFYHKVPLDVMQTYGETDARITFEIGEKQSKLLQNFEWDTPRSTWLNPFEIERALTPVLYYAEREGIPVDEYLCHVKAGEETKAYENAAREFHDKTGKTFVDSAEALRPFFKGYHIPKTPKGGDSFNEEWLSSIEHPLAPIILQHREHSKLANTYYKNFLYYRAESGLLHANARQNGTRTGRLSYSDPNLQNVPDGPVRSAFLAPKDFCLVSIDFDQQEYRMMLDYAGQIDVIDMILQGLDVHEATAQLMGVTRKAAKTVNFALLYGSGVVKLTMQLFPVTCGEQELWCIWKMHRHLRMDKKEKDYAAAFVTREMTDANLPHLLAARDLRETYFARLPKVSDWLTRVKDQAVKRGYLRSWTGRRLQCPKPAFSYKMPNALIQGGASDVIKLAMIDLDSMLLERKSKLLLSVHDELLFKIHHSELALVPEIVERMQSIYPYKRLPLTCSVSHSWRNWGELEDGAPEKARDEIQGKGLGGLKETSPSLGA